MIESIKQELIKRKAVKLSLEQKIDQRRCQIKKLQRELKNADEARCILQHTAEQTQKQLEYKISEIVSLAIQSIFDEPYEFKLEFVQRRNKTEADIYFELNGYKYNPMTDNGGGIVDVASFALRIALWNLQNPQSRNTIILDEPFRFLSEDLQPRAGEFLKTLSDKLSIQFIIVTHNKNIIESSDSLFHVKKIKGRSIIEQK